MAAQRSALPLWCSRRSCKLASSFLHASPQIQRAAHQFTSCIMLVLIFKDLYVCNCPHSRPAACVGYAGADKAEAHGDRDPAAGADGHRQRGPERERDAGEIRDHGWRARQRREHPNQVRPMPLFCLCPFTPFRSRVNVPGNADFPLPSFWKIAVNACPAKAISEMVCQNRRCLSCRGELWQPSVEGIWACMQAVSVAI